MWAGYSHTKVVGLHCSQTRLWVWTVYEKSRIDSFVDNPHPQLNNSRQSMLTVSYGRTLAIEQVGDRLVNQERYHTVDCELE